MNTDISNLIGFSYNEEHGVADSVLLSDVSEESFLANLKLRYQASKM
jgi:hypothetical protein